MSTRIKSVIILFFVSSSLLFGQLYLWKKVANTTNLKDFEITNSRKMFVSYVTILYEIKFEVSTDFGFSWNTKSIKPTTLEFSSNSDLAFGTEFELPKLYLSFNEFNSWSIINLPIGNIQSAEITENDFVMIGNDDGYIAFSSDSCQTWDTVKIFSQPIKKIHSLKNNQIFAVADSGIARTTDLGYSWEYISDFNYVNDLESDSLDNLYVFSGSEIFRSSDEGNTWSMIISGIQSVNDMLVTKGGKIFIASDSSGISEYDNVNNEFVERGTLKPKKLKSLDNDNIFAFDHSGRVFWSKPEFSQINYLPLSIQNYWQLYFHFRSLSHDVWGMSNRIVLNDTLIEGMQYFKIQDYQGENWVRYDSTDKKILVWHNDAEHLLADFYKSEGEPYSIYLPGHSSYIEVKGAEKNVIICGDTVRCRGWVHDTGYSQRKEFFAENLGFCFEEAEGGSGWSENKVIELLIHDSSGQLVHMGHNHSPQFFFDPITTVSTPEFQLEMTVDHYYTHFYYSLYYTSSQAYFIKSVLLESFYQKGQLKTPIDSTYAVHTQWTKTYTVSLNLDQNLLNSGYVFLYKVIATDKAIIPHITVAPDYGYYTCILDTTTSVIEDEEIPNEFRLYSNYPNPFNPVTKIKYSIPTSPQTPLLSKEKGRGEVVLLKVFDILGNEITTLVNKIQSPGIYEVEFDGSNLPSGIYIYTLRTANFFESRKMLLLK